MLQFRPEDRGRVASGDITVSYRLWRRRHVRPQREYATGFGTVYVESVEELPAGLIDPRTFR